MRAVATIALLSMLTACTYVFTREYVVEPAENASPEEVENIFQAFSDFLGAKGFPLAYQARPEPRLARYRIGGSDAGFAQRQDYEDILELSYEGGTSFRLRLRRIVHHEMDFSDQYLKGFVADTERFIREATSKPVRIKLVPTGRT
jgi:hypothetical protein